MLSELSLNVFMKTAFVVDARLSIGRIMSTQKLGIEWSRWMRTLQYDDVTYMRNMRTMFEQDDMYSYVNRDFSVCDCNYYCCEFRLTCVNDRNF